MSTTRTPAVLELRDLHIRYQTSANKIIQAVNGISLRLERGGLSLVIADPFDQGLREWARFALPPATPFRKP